MNQSISSGNKKQSSGKTSYIVCVILLLGGIIAFYINDNWKRNKPFPPIPPETIVNSSPVPVVGKHWNVMSLDLGFRWIPSGSFFMGSAEDEKDRRDDEQLHQVSITQGFWMAQFETRIRDFEFFVSKSGYISESENEVDGYGSWVFDKTKNEIISASGRNWRNVHNHGPDHPVMAVSYFDAMAFCEWLTAFERDAGRITELMKFTLPTEAQWEFSCKDRSHSSDTFYFGNSLSSRLANFNGHFPYGEGQQSKYLEKSAPVGQYAPNWLGLYDMHGNTFEWCLDWYSPYQTNSTPHGIIDPQGPEDGKDKIYRGGSWFDVSGFCRSAFRGKTNPHDRSDHLGFRIVLINLPYAESTVEEFE